MVDIDDWDSGAEIHIDGDSVVYNGYIYQLVNDTTNHQLVLHVTEPAVYVNSAWNETSCGGYTWGVDAFSSFSTAKNRAENKGGRPKKIIGLTDTGSTQSGTIVLEGIKTELTGAGTYTGVVMGGDRLLSDTKTATKNTNLSISDGTYTKNVVGGGYAGNAEHVELTQNGTTSLTISGGVFKKAVAGGMYAYNAEGSTDAKVTLDAGSASNTAVNFTISGGTFNGRIYGGNYAYDDKATEANSVIKGSVNLVIDSSENVINILGGIDAGSRGTGTGMITGDVKVTFTGNGNNLDFGDIHPSVFGGCNMDGYKKLDESQETKLVSGVEGNRILTFDNFHGNYDESLQGYIEADFDANIRLFDTLEVINGAQVNLTNKDLDLTDIENWNLSGGRLFGINDWDFSGETLIFNTDLKRISERTLMTGVDGEIKFFDKVVLNGVVYSPVEGSQNDSSIAYSCGGDMLVSLFYLDNGFNSGTSDDKKLSMMYEQVPPF